MSKQPRTIPRHSVRPGSDPATSNVSPGNGAETSGRIGVDGLTTKTASSPVPASEVSRWLDLLSAQLRQAYLESTRALVATVEAKDRFTERHSSRVSRYSRQIAVRMGLPREDVACVTTAARLHDIGKIGVPDAILNKPGPLTEAELESVRRHPTIAFEILGHTTFLEKELPLILHHHERYDGCGYPAGLAGEQIPLGARILNLADSLDAMLSRRSYKAPLSPPRARMELQYCSGRQFDPAVVEAALKWMDEAGELITADPARRPPPSPGKAG